MQSVGTRHLYRSFQVRNLSSPKKSKNVTLAKIRNNDPNATAVVIGASRGIGLALTREIAQRFKGKVFGLCRQPEAADRLSELVQSGKGLIYKGQVDVEDEQSVIRAASLMKNINGGRVDILVNCAGLLWTDEHMPETSVTRITKDFMEQCFRVNCLGAALIIKHFSPLMTIEKNEKRVPSVLASISARVGSIEDCVIGGWYSYRISKAAQNMLTRAASVEVGRKGVIVVGLHPGTVATDLSSPWHKNVRPEKLFKVEDSARMLADVIDSLELKDNGSFRAYDGGSISF